MKTQTILSWIFRLIAAIILLQTLFFKFSAAEESVYIFSQLGLEPYGRIGIGVAELIVSVLLLIPRTAWLGAIGGIGIISGAIVAHLTKLGIIVQNDGGLLFYLAIAVFVSCSVVFFLHRDDARNFVQKSISKTGVANG